jgi:hypothetical protein
VIKEYKWESTSSTVLQWKNAFIEVTATAGSKSVSIRCKGNGATTGWFDKLYLNASNNSF